MRAEEVLRLYAAGDRDFRGANLRGQSFKREDLSDADFSEADIRGANFANATLVGACFREAKAGLQWHSKTCWSVFLISVILISLSSSLLQLTKIPQWIITAIGVSVYQTVLTLLIIGLWLLIFGFIAYVLLDPNEERKDKRITSLVTRLGGTNFREANLTKAIFLGTTVSYTNFTNSILTRVNWKDAKGLEQTISQGTYLTEARVRKLLTTLDGRDRDFDQLNLQGVNLQGANLQGTSLIQTNLNEASLQDANLTDARLVQALLDRTDLTGATLTGAYIEDWNITINTKLNGIECNYIFMRLPPDKRPAFIALSPEENRNPNPRRKPDDWNRNFEDGEFAEFIEPMRLTLDLYHNWVVDPRLAAIALQQLIDNNPKAELGIVAMGKKGKRRDKLHIKVETTPQADLSTLHSEYFSNLDYLNSLSPEEKTILLRERGEVIQLLFKQKTSDISINTNLNNSLTQGDNNMTGDNATHHSRDRIIHNVGGDYRETNVSGQAQYAERDINFNGEVAMTSNENTYHQSGKFGIGHMSGGEIKEGAKVAAEINEAQQQNLSAAVAEVQQILQQLSQTHPSGTVTEKMAIATEAVKQIEGDPTLKQRLLNAAKEGGLAAIEKTFDNPIGAFVVSAIKGWQEAE